MTLTKSRIVNDLHTNSGLLKRESAHLIELTFEVMRQTLESGEDILISGFGKFSVKEKNKRRGRNPAIGNDLILDARKVVTFKCSPILKNKINCATQKNKGANKETP